MASEERYREIDTRLEAIENDDAWSALANIVHLVFDDFGKPFQVAEKYRLIVQTLRDAGLDPTGPRAER